MQIFPFKLLLRTWTEIIRIYVIAAYRGRISTL